MDKISFHKHARKLLDPIVGVMAALAVPPLLVSLFGLVFSLYGAVVVADGKLFLGGIFLIVSGFCDVLDGDLARRRGLVSRFGAFMDSTLDRVTEFAFFTGILFYITNRHDAPHNLMLCVIMIALAGSVLTSYTRARAEGLGYECKVGIMERPERVVLLAIGLLLGYRVLNIVMVVLAVTATYTFLQRVVHVRRVSSENSRPADDTPVPPAGPDPPPGE